LSCFARNCASFGMALTYPSDKTTTTLSQGNSDTSANPQEFLQTPRVMFVQTVETVSSSPPTST
jgi:hypothetical protein